MAIVIRSAAASSLSQAVLTTRHTAEPHVSRFTINLADGWWCKRPLRVETCLFLRGSSPIHNAAQHIIPPAVNAIEIYPGLVNCSAVVSSSLFVYIVMDVKFYLGMVLQCATSIQQPTGKVILNFWHFPRLIRASDAVSRSPAAAAAKVDELYDDPIKNLFDGRVSLGWYQSRSVAQGRNARPIIRCCAISKKKSNCHRRHLTTHSGRRGYLASSGCLMYDRRQCCCWNYDVIGLDSETKQKRPCSKFTRLFFSFSDSSVSIASGRIVCCCFGGPDGAIGKDERDPRSFVPFRRESACLENTKGVVFIHIYIYMRRAIFPIFFSLLYI